MTERVITKSMSSEKKSTKAAPAKASSKNHLQPAPNPTEARTVKTFEVGLTDQLISDCKEKLLVIKADLLNRVKETRSKLDQFEHGGDEADQTMRILAEQEMLNLTDRLRSQLLEIESALARIENGTFGYCEETEEMIETDRLRAIPWTRLSIEGAEIRESMGKRYAR